MYLHIGNDNIINKKNILFILDYEKVYENNTFKQFIKNIGEKNIIDISSEKRKSIIITKEKDIVKAYISNISSNTLSKRK